MPITSVIKSAPIPMNTNSIVKTINPNVAWPVDTLAALAISFIPGVFFVLWVRVSIKLFRCSIFYKTISDIKIFGFVDELWGIVFNFIRILNGFLLILRFFLPWIVNLNTFNLLVYEYFLWIYIRRISLYQILFKVLIL